MTTTRSETPLDINTFMLKCERKAIRHVAEFGVPEDPEESAKEMSMNLAEKYDDFELLYETGIETIKTVFKNPHMYLSRFNLKMSANNKNTGKK